MEGSDHKPTVPKPPLLSVIFEALKERGWQIEGGVYIDPEGNRCLSLEQAVFHQSLREIGES